MNFRSYVLTDSMAHGLIILEQFSSWSGNSLLLWTQIVITVFTKDSHCTLLLNEFSPIHLWSRVFERSIERRVQAVSRHSQRSISVLHFHLSLILRSGFFPWVSCNESSCTCLFLFSHMCDVLLPLHFSSFNHHRSIWRRVQIVMLVNVIFSIFLLLSFF